MSALGTLAHGKRKRPGDSVVYAHSGRAEALGLALARVFRDAVQNRLGRRDIESLLGAVPGALEAFCARYYQNEGTGDWEHVPGGMQNQDLLAAIRRLVGRQGQSYRLPPTHAPLQGWVDCIQQARGHAHTRRRTTAVGDNEMRD